MILETINGHLAAQGLMMREGTIVDATLIAASPATKSKDKKRDPEMHQSKKGNDWHFGLKAHIGVDSASGLVHTVIGSAGNVSDVTQAHTRCCMAMKSRRWATPATRASKKRKENLRKSVDVARRDEALESEGAA
jgi:IS5 family transposase